MQDVYTGDEKKFTQGTNRANCIYMDLTVYILGMLLLGTGVGIISGSLGLGGGIIMVPAFIAFIPDMDPHTAKGTSLFIIIFVALLNAWRQTRKWEARPWHLAAYLAAGSIVGGYLGSWITNLLSGQIVLGIFIVLLVVLAWRTFFIQPREVNEDSLQQRRIISVLIGLFAGFAGGATGTGGGSVLIPLALLAGIVSNNRAVGLSNMVMVATAIAGSIANLQTEAIYASEWTYGLIAFNLVPLIFIGSQIGSPIGRRLNTRLTLERRRVVMGVFILVITLRLAWEFIGALL